MALIKEERFTNEEGIEMIREYFCKDEDHISATVNYLALKQQTQIYINNVKNMEVKLWQRKH